MRVLIVSHKYHPEFGGGAAEYCRDIASLLKASGNEVSILVASPDSPSEDLVEGIEVRRIGPLQDRHFRTTYLRTISKEIRDYLKSYAPDVIHFNSLSRFGLTPLVLAREDKIPAVMTVHDFPMICARNNLLDREGRPCSGPGRIKCTFCAGRRMPRHLVFSSTFRNLSTDINMICPSEFAARLVRTSGLGKNISTMKHFVPLAFRGFLDSRVVRPSDYADSILFCGRLNRAKGLPILVSIARHFEYPIVRLDIVGPVDNVVDLPDLMESKSIVRVHGFLKTSELLERFASARILIFPSIWPEVFGLVLLQGLVAGLPVIASSVGAVPEIVRDGLEGCLVMPGDHDGFVKAIEGCLSDRVILSKMSIRAFKRGSMYTPEKYVDKLISLYEESIAKATR